MALASPPELTPDAKYVPAIDGLRALAVLAVIVFHLRPRFLPGGFAGVDVFFVISGFVVTASLARRRGRGLGAFLAAFYRARLLRIMPALLVMLVTVSALTAFFVRGEGVLAARQIGLPAFFGIANIALQRSGDPYFSAGADYNPFLHTWTLGVEEQFYLVLPFVLFWAWRAGGGTGERRSLALVAALSAASFALCAILSRTSPAAAFYMMSARFWELGAGAILFLTRARWLPVLQRSAGAGAALAAASLATLAACFLLAGKSGLPLSGIAAAVAATAALLALACARPGDLVPRLLSLRPALLVGICSYSLYLWHWPVFVLMRWTVGVEGVAKGLIALAVTAIVSAASYRLVERPARTSHFLHTLRFRYLLAGVAAATVTCAAAAALLVYGQAGFASRTATAAYWDGPPLAGGCRGGEARQPFADGQVHVWTPACPSTGPIRRLIVVGDSHAMGYAKMLRRYAADTGTTVIVYSKNGCGFLRFGNPVSREFDCRAFDAALGKELPRIARRGDVLFFTAMRVPHLIDWRTGLPSGDRPATDAERARDYRQAYALLQKISAKGAHAILEAPKPVFRFVPMRCSDWFNRSNMVCAHGPNMARDALLSHRASVAGEMARLAQSLPAVSVWDPFPALCPGELCSPYSADGPIYTDDNHLSGRGNDLLYRPFADHLQRKFGR